MRNSSGSFLCGLTTLLLLAWSGTMQAQLSDVTQPGDPVVPTSNNSPGSEGVANAIDNQPTKYLNFDKLNTGFTVTPRVGLSVVQCISLTSANDAPERDPSSFLLSGSYDGTNFTQMASNSVPTFTNRFQKIVIGFSNNTPYLIYRLIFPTVANAGTANSMQISEVELLGFLAPTDVTQPGDPIVPSSNNSPGSEGVANAIDNQPTKYLNFDKLNTGFTVTPSVGGTLVSGLTLTSANDAPERDPASYVLRGSLDGIAFFDISSGPVPPFPTRFYKNYIFFSNSRAYKAYQLIFPTVANAATANSMQISEVELLGVVADVPQDITQPGDPIVPTSNNSPGSEGVANAIDNQPTKYLNFDKLNTGFTVSPRAGLTIVSGLTLTSANDAPERDPASYTLSGSYDGSNFTQIASGTVPVFASRFQKQTFLFDNKIPYLQYRLIFPTVANASAANSMQISEVELLGVLAPTDVTVPGDPIVATSNNSPGSEGVANAIDNQPTKYLNFDKLNTGFTVTPGVGDTIVIGLTLTSANDAPERDPASYDLSGSNDGVDFVPISSGAVPPFPTRFYKNYIFFPDNTKSFKSYRLIFPTVANPAAANSMQISEVEFLGVTPGVINTNPATDLIVRQPVDTPVLLGSMATFRVELSGPWKVQWYRNGVAIPGATTATYTTPPATAADDGALFKAVVQSPHGVQTSDEVMLSIFTPSTTECIGLSWRGSGANGAPTAMLPDDITGFQKQAYWNNLTGGSGSLANPINSSNVANPTITVTWATSGEWGVGTGNQDATERMLNGMATSFGTTPAGAQMVTFSGVPAGNHSLFLYTVQVPKEFFNMDFTVTTHDSGGNDVVQQRFIRPQNSDEYNPNPGFFLVTATDAASRDVGNMMRFDNLQPGPDGIIQISFYAPGRAQPPNAEPIRGPGLNGLQLCLNPPPAPPPPVITQEPVSANGLAGGCITLSVEATGPGLIYQWFKNNQKIAGATSPRLTLSNLGTNDPGSYFVEVSNPAGTVHSRTAVVGILASSQLTLGLITYFKFDDQGGVDTVTTANEVPAGQLGHILGGNPVPDWPPGQVGYSIALDGIDYMFVSDYPKPSQAMTVAGWVLSYNDLSGPIINNWITGRPIGSSGQFLVDVVLDNGVPTLRGEIEVGPNKVLTSGPIDTTLGVWHHFAMSANGVTLSIYWDGRLVGSVDYLGSINASPFPWLAVGARFDPTTQPADPNPLPDPTQPLFPGWMDDLALWNRSLSAIEIQGIYNGGLASLDISQVAPVLTVGTCPPTIVCSTNIVAECTGGLTPVSYTVSAVDSAGAPVPVVCVPPSGAGFQFGTSNVVCTATDSLGQSASCTFRVTIVDTTPPQIGCSTNITVSTPNSAGTGVSYIVSASDGCGLAFLDCSPPSGSTFPIGTTTVLCHTADTSGNSNSCSFNITVMLTTPPVLSCPSNIVAECTGGLTPVTFNVSAVDAGGAPVPVTCAPPSGTGFRLGTSNVTCTATDSHGLSSSCAFTVTVVDTTPPRVSCPGDITAETTNAAGAVVTYVAGASDACGLSTFACLPPSGSVFPLGTTTVTCRATDTAGNANSCSFDVTVSSPNEPPVCDTRFSCTWTEAGTFYAIALDGAEACLVLDGSGSTDPDVGDTLQFTWIVDGTNTTTGAVVTNCLATGCHAVKLVVSDGLATSTCERRLCVITASEGVEQCIGLVESSDIVRKNKRPLIASLKAASASFERGSLESGLNQLHAFQNKVRAQISRDNPAEAAAFIRCAQKIIDAVNCASQ